MTIEATTRGIEARNKRRSAVLASLALGAVLSGALALAGTAQQADAASPEKIVFVSERTTGKGVSNPTGDAEIFRMNPNGTGVRQLTFNQADEFRPFLSPDGQKIVYTSSGEQASNPEGDEEVYVMNSDGNKRKNLTNNGLDADGFGANDWTHFAEFSADGQKILYSSQGAQASNPEGEAELYLMNAPDGSAKKNLTNNTARDHYAEWGR